MADDRNALFSEVKGFSQRKLNKVETKVVTSSGDVLVEKRGPKGLQVKEAGNEAEKLDLQVGLIIPNLLIASDDVSQHLETLKLYGINHILNLDSSVANNHESECKYKNIDVKDEDNFELGSILEECFQFLDEGRKSGNVLVHCKGSTNLSRSTSICIAYLMAREKMKYIDALNAVKEARSFVKPSENFAKQLKAYESKLGLA